MKSISIVYKRPRKELIQEQIVDTVRIKRSVDEYYSRLAQKTQKKLHESQFRTQTVKSIRIKDKNKILGSMNIMKLGSSSPPIHSKLNNQKNGNQKKNFTIKKTQPNFFSFKVPNQDTLLIEQRLKDNGAFKGCKLKSLHQLSKKKDTIVVLSVDFILNEFNFWEEESIDQYSVRAWKTIQNIASIVWLVRRENSLKKIYSFIKENHLNQDGVYLVLPKKVGKTLTVNFSTLQRQIKLQTNNKLIVINGIRVQDIHQLHYSIFYSLIPHIKHIEAYVHFVQIDINDKFRFNDVLKILSQNLPKPTNINSMFREFQEKQEPIENKTKKKCQKVTHQFILERIETLKKNYCNYFNNAVAVSKFEGEQSIPYIVGDMLKRNYQMLTEAYNQMRLREQTSEMEEIQRQEIVPLKATKNLYNRPVYFWKF